MSTTVTDSSELNTEAAIAALWQEVLQTDTQPDASDNFFSLGGDSMSMVVLEFRITEEFDVTLPPGAVLSAPTLCEQAALVEAARDTLATDIDIDVKDDAETNAVASIEIETDINTEIDRETEHGRA